MVGLAQRALARVKSRQPVRDAVAKFRMEIYEARKKGVSWAVLHAQLSSEGVYVGRGPSSLISAAKYWAEMDGMSLSKTSSPALGKTESASDANFTDQRFALDWGRP
jgi:hypothetical protein